MLANRDRRGGIGPAQGLAPDESRHLIAGGHVPDVPVKSLSERPHSGRREPPYAPDQGLFREPERTIELLTYLLGQVLGHLRSSDPLGSPTGGIMKACPTTQPTW